jgi:hypothetical protein
MAKTFGLLHTNPIGFSEGLIPKRFSFQGDLLSSSVSDRSRMNWFAYISLVILSAFSLANALAFHRAAKEWAENLSDALGIVPSNPTFPGLIFLPGKIQDALVPPCVAVWFWVGFISVLAESI